MTSNEIKQNNLEAEKDAFLKLTNDYTFTEVMKNPFILKGFLSDVLGIPIRDIESIRVVDRYLGRGFKEGKLGILDIKVEVSHVGIIDIELQMLDAEDWENRSIFYTSRIFAENVRKGDDYLQCKKVISISILGFDLCKDTDYFYSRFHLMEDERHTFYSDMLEFHVIELGKVGCIPRAEHKKLHKWARLFSTNNEEERMIIEKDPYIEEALKELERISNDPARRQEYEDREDALRDYRTLKESARRQGRRQGLAEGLAEGEAKGKAEGEAKMIEVIIKKIDKKKTVEEIADMLEQDTGYIRAIADLRKAHPEHSAIEIAKELAANK